MKIMHLISGGDAGGAKTHVLTNLSVLRSRIEVRLVCLSDGPFYREAVEQQIPTLLLEQKARIDLSIRSKILRTITEDGYDILHCHGARANFIGGLLKSKLSIPVITTIHSDYKLDFSHNLLKNLIFTPVNYFSLKKMDYYLSVTDNFKQQLISRGFPAERIYTIYNGIKTEVQLKQYQQGRQLILGCVTRFVPIKGTHILLEAIARVKRQGYQPQLRIAGMGKGKYAQSLFDFVEQNQLQENVEFLGFVRDMDSYYQSIDVNILPSYTEGFPYSLLESGVRGICTIATATGGIVEMIEDGQTGRLFEVGAVETLADILKQLFDGQIDPAQLGGAFRQQIVERFSDQVMADNHIRIYQDIIQRTKKK